MVFVDIVGPSGSRTVTFPSAELAIGSTSNNDLQLGHADVARHHALIIERAGHAVIMDLGTSALGTLVNGELIKDATVLTDDCMVTIGPFQLAVRFVEVEPDTLQPETMRLRGQGQTPSAPPPSIEVVMPSSSEGEEIEEDENPTVARQVPSPESMAMESIDIPVSSDQPISYDVTRILASPHIPTAVEPAKPAEPPEPPVNSDNALTQQIVVPMPIVAIGKAESKPPPAMTTTEVIPKKTPSTPPSAERPERQERAERQLTNPLGIQRLLKASSDPTEVAFLKAVVEDTDAAKAREVYAKWLDEKGDPLRAEYIRLIDKIDRWTEKSSRDQETLDRLRQLSARIAKPWLAAVAPRSMRILLCPTEMLLRTFKSDQPSGCPKTWGAMPRYSVDELRHCPTCLRFVHYVSDMEAARRLAARSEPFVIDPTVPRKNDDLDALPTSQRHVIEENS